MNIKTHFQIFDKKIGYESKIVVLEYYSFEMCSNIHGLLVVTLIIIREILKIQLIFVLMSILTIVLD
jgi:hypothetical protein